MAFREGMFLILGVPTIFYGIKIMLGLKRVDLSSGRIFLRSDRFLLFLKSLLIFTIFCVVAAITLYFWWITELDIMRIIGGLALIGASTLLLLALHQLKTILGV